MRAKKKEPLFKGLNLSVIVPHDLLSDLGDDLFLKLQFVDRTHEHLRVDSCVPRLQMLVGGVDRDAPHEAPHDATLVLLQVGLHVGEHFALPFG